MANIDYSMSFLLLNEGGFSNNPYDLGGCTNYGITQETLAIWRHAAVSCADVRALPLDEAKLLYKVHYWDAMKLDAILDQNIATCLFDTAVNRGVGVSRQYAHEICAQMNKQKVNDCERSAFICLFAKRVRQGYDNIIAMNPSQRIFEGGWHNRADRLLTLV